MIAKHLVLEVERASNTQVHVVTADGIKLLDTSMVYDGQKFETSEQIIAYYETK